MIFNHLMGLKEENKEKTIYRNAVRAIIFRDRQLLMISNNKGDIKFPGGGLKQDENHEEALKREVEEESGYQIDEVKELLGLVVERRQDQFDENQFFEMKSSYYLCTITENLKEQSLDDYESDLDFKPRWIEIDEAIRINNEALKNEEINPWVQREIYVLNRLKEGKF